MSPTSPAVGGPALLSSLFTLLGIPSGYIDTMDFNGSATRLPPLAGPDRVGVRHFTIQHDMGFRFWPPSECTNVNTSLPQLRERYGEDGDSFINETCSGVRHIPVSVFYPTCESLQEPQNKTDLVFTQSLLETITAQVFGSDTSMHNMVSQAFPNASVCPDKYSMVLLSPPVGGQRQAYTQLASDIASHHHVVVTVDHIFQSGAIEMDNGNLLFNLAGDLVKPREANNGRVVDLMAVALHFNESSNLDPLLWGPGTEIDLLNTYVFGHGQGGQAARLMIANNFLSGGGTLDSLIRLPAPYNESNIMYKPRHKKPTSQPKPLPGAGEESGDRLGDNAGELENGWLDRIKNMARGLGKTMMDSLSTLMCRVLGNCENKVQKRGVTPAYYDHERWDHHYDYSCDDICLLNCRLECKPDVPHGFFPDDFGQSSGKTFPDDGDWDEDWKEYHDTIGDYEGFPGRNPYRQHEKSCYDDDYCSYKCCYKDDHHEDDYDWEDEYKGHRHHYNEDQEDHYYGDDDEYPCHRHHYDEDQEDDWAQQDERRVPDRWWDEDDSPSSRPDGTVTPPGSDQGTKHRSEKPIHRPDEDRFRDDDQDESKHEDDEFKDEESNPKDDEGDSEGDEDDSKGDEDDSQNDEDDASHDEDGSQDDEDTDDEL
ncbi:hypothetical protein N0V82_010134 [Gnomoniopsis sp. IMI 355080]|nr:hypothetical protein N0V82_010134 [Gnomoniopsis sp. IMI 355080]